jgi:RNA polymerase sigma factor (sigma-70 family)
MPTRDDELWRKAQAGDADAFGVLFDRHADAVFRYCFRRTGDWALAEDLTSVVFLETWRRGLRRPFQGESARPWFYGVATNVLRNQQRTLRRHRSALARIPPLRPESDFADDLPRRVDAQRDARALLQQVRGLPRGEQDVLALCVWEGLTSSETAAALDVPETTVRTRLARARSRLRGDLATKYTPRERMQRR